MMSHYFAGDAALVVDALLLIVLCLFLRRLAPMKPDDKEGRPDHSGVLALRRWPDPK